MNRYVKIEGHKNWFLVLEPGQKEPDGLSERSQQQMLRKTVFTLHDRDKPLDDFRRIIMIGTKDLNYEQRAAEMGAILIRPIGSYMPLMDSKITQECYSLHFPIDNHADIVICENDERPNGKWVNYLSDRFGGQSIATISFFDLRTESEVAEYFSKAKYITFSTTFTQMEWFEKLCRHLTKDHKVIGFSHDESAWPAAIAMCPNSIEVVADL